MEIIEALQNLNLSEKEAKVYMALLGLGEATAYAIAHKSGLKKPTTYVVIDELIKKGLATKVPRVKKSIYTAKSPEDLLAEAENRLRIVKEKLPEMQALVKGQKKKPRVYFFEGLQGSKQAMQYGLKRMKGQEMVAFWATARKETIEQFDYFKDFNDTLKSLNISLRGVAPSDPVLKEFRKADKEYKRNVKTISTKEYNPTVSIELGDSFVKIQDFDNLQNIIIENENITNSLKQIFEMVWSSRK